MEEEISCSNCKKIFYVRGFRFCNAKTLTCIYCKIRFNCENQNRRLCDECHKKYSEGWCQYESKGSKLTHDVSVPSCSNLGISNRE